MSASIGVKKLAFLHKIKFSYLLMFFLQFQVVTVNSGLSAEMQNLILYIYGLLQDYVNQEQDIDNTSEIPEEYRKVASSELKNLIAGTNMKGVRGITIPRFNLSSYSVKKLIHIHAYPLTSNTTHISFPKEEEISSLQAWIQTGKKKNIIQVKPYKPSECSESYCGVTFSGTEVRFANPDECCRLHSGILLPILEKNEERKYDLSYEDQNQEERIPGLSKS